MRKILLYSLLIIILFTGIAFAQSPAISNGLAWLKSTQSPEGYWGDALRFNTIPSLTYIMSVRNADGGWAFRQAQDGDASTGSGQAPGDESNAYMTAMVSITLQQYSIDIDLANAINNATDYLIDQQQADGGWGSIYETVPGRAKNI
jgi:squalene cyclase